MIQGKFKILSQQKAGPECFKMSIFAPAIARCACPGQFVHLRCQEGPEPLLRRPLSFHRIYQDKFEVLYRIAGRGTALLAKKQEGDTIDVIGPLGKGFVFPSTVHREPQTANRKPQTAILVAGGMGAAPLLALAEALAGGKNALPDEQEIIILLGAKTKTELLCEKTFKELGCDVRVATDDGTKGHKGFVTELFKEVLQSTINNIRTGDKPVPAIIYACGPHPMLKEVARISMKFDVPAQGALEEKMACGVGACLGCVVETSQGYQRVCKDGPVFDLSEIKWDTETRE
ncbi:MAG: dihydroorotate dehydrogenase electron transfer subunit [Candidatus Omnitrophota bacterium]